MPYPIRKRGMPWKTGTATGVDEQSTPVNVHVPIPVRPLDPIFTDKLGNAFLIDASTGVSLALPRLDRTAVNGLLARELTKYAPNSDVTNIEALLRNLVEMSKRDGKIGIDAINTVLDRVLGKPVQETKNLNVNANAETLDDLLNAIEPKRETVEHRPPTHTPCDTSTDVCEDVSQDC